MSSNISPPGITTVDGVNDGETTLSFGLLDGPSTSQTLAPSLGASSFSLVSTPSNESPQAEILTPTSQHPLLPQYVKQPQPWQRTLPNETSLTKEFTSESTQDDSGLKALMDYLITSDFYDNHTLEPQLGSSESDVILEDVRKKTPNDPRFNLATSPDGLDKGSSIYNLFANKQDGCLFSVWNDDASVSKCPFKAKSHGRYTDHVRTHLDHRPFVCRGQSGDNKCGICILRYVDDSPPHHMMRGLLIYAPHVT